LLSAFRIENNRQNYPLEQPLGLATPSEAEHLIEEARLRRREFLDSEPSQSQLRHAIIGPPGTVLDSGARGPTFDDVADDDRWLLKPGKLLMASPGESPEPLTLSTPWAPGEYRIWVRLHRPLLKMGYRNHFQVEVLGGEQEKAEVDGEMADSSGRVDLGIRTVDRSLEVRFSHPEGGVGIVGLELELMGSGPEEIVPVDDDLEERLRALGYLQ